MPATVKLKRAPSRRDYDRIGLMAQQPCECKNGVCQPCEARALLNGIVRLSETTGKP